MIDQNRRARLAGFGLLAFETDPTDHKASTPAANILGSVRWMSPELLDPRRFGFRDCQKTKESDCYALGMVMLEVLSGQLPFEGDRNVAVMRKVTDGECPKRPKEAWFTDEVWEILECCWVLDPRGRPKLQGIVQCLGKASPSWATLFHLVPSTTNSSEMKFSGPDRILTMDADQATSGTAWDVLHQPTRESTAHGSGSRLGKAPVRSFGPLSSRGGIEKDFHTPSNSGSSSCTEAENGAQMPIRSDETPTKFSNQRSYDLTRRELNVEDLDKVLSFHRSWLQSN